MELKEIIAKVENTPVPDLKKVALAFSGGLDSSLAVELLRRRYKVKDAEDLKPMLLSAG